MSIDKSVNSKGEYVRKASTFRNCVTADGSSGFKAEKGRYHLYVSLACPWAHRTLIVRKLKGLSDVISVDVVDWLLQMEKGWRFSPEKEGCTEDTINGFESIREVYQKSSSDFTGKVTVPVLFDKVTGKIVNNESSEIIRMLNREFNAFCPTVEQQELDFYPEHLRKSINSLNEWIYPDINNGVYRAGFAQSQEAYDNAVTALFKALDKVEDILSRSRYLTGNTLTEADIRLFATLIRFDAVYVGHFKCNKHRIKDFPNLSGYLRDIYQTGGISETVNMKHITYHYQMSHPSINKFGIVSIGPDDLNFDAPHDRAKMVST